MPGGCILYWFQLISLLTNIPGLNVWLLMTLNMETVLVVNAQTEFPSFPNKEIRWQILERSVIELEMSEFLRNLDRKKRPLPFPNLSEYYIFFFLGQALCF